MNATLKKAFEALRDDGIGLTGGQEMLLRHMLEPAGEALRRRVTVCDLAHVDEASYKTQCDLREKAEAELAEAKRVELTGCGVHGSCYFGACPECYRIAVAEVERLKARLKCGHKNECACGACLQCQNAALEFALSAEKRMVESMTDTAEQYTAALERLRERTANDAQHFTCPRCGCHWFMSDNIGATSADSVRRCRSCNWKGTIDEARQEAQMRIPGGA